jgi:hypothetical protein
MDVNFYGCMKQKFEMQASVLFLVLDHPEGLVVDVPLPPEHPINTVSYCATTKIETHIHVNPQELKSSRKTT